MKICITCSGTDLDSQVDPRFGRCQYFLITDEKGNLIKSIPNPSGGAMRGAGIAAAQVIADEGTNIIITGNIGPNAFMVLNQAGVEIYPGVFGATGREALEKFNQGQLTKAQAAAPPGPPSIPPFGPGRGGKGFGGPGRGRRGK